MFYAHFNYALSTYLPIFSFTPSKQYEVKIKKRNKMITALTHPKLMDIN